MHHKHMSYCLVDTPYRQAFIVNMTRAYLSQHCHIFLFPLPARSSFQTQTPQINSAIIIRTSVAEAGLRLNFLSLKKNKKKTTTLMSMIKMTVMRGWDRDMNLTLTRNAKSNSIGFWL